ncbi:MAG TPA: TetR/AcrR family transcriptional regulator [Nevskiaceae bacterium]|nr:TetR/AcrR family transcriptional regulator [Nevskiaceae bacterium]
MPSVTRSPRRRPVGPAPDLDSALAAALTRLLAAGTSFTALSVEALAREAGMARSTFYLHFRDKGELVRRLLQRVREDILSASAVWFDDPAGADRAALEQAVRGILGAYQRHRAVMRAVTETAAYDPAVDAAFQDLMQALSQSTRRGIQRVREAGGTRGRMPGEVGDALTWMVERCCQQMLATPGRAAQERLVRALAHILWHAIHAPDD